MASSAQRADQGSGVEILSGTCSVSLPLTVPSPFSTAEPKRPLGRQSFNSLVLHDKTPWKDLSSTAGQKALWPLWRDG